MRASHSSLCFLILIVSFVSVPCDGQALQDTGQPRPAAPSAEKPAGQPRAVSGLEGIPPNQLAPVMEAHYRGIGLMERYDYVRAEAAFRDAHQRAPNWVPGMINLAIANYYGGDIDRRPEADWKRAIDLLTRAIEREPENLSAHYCRGLVLRAQDQQADAHQEFLIVTRADPTDAYAWLQVGATLPDIDGPRRPIVLARIEKKLIPIYTKAVEQNPFLLTALYHLQNCYRLTGNRAKADDVLQRWRLLNRDTNLGGAGETASNYYGEQGRYALLIDPFPASTGEPRSGPPPRFEAPVPLKISLRAGERWARPDDFVGTLAVIGRARARFGAAISVFDADGDGRVDLFLAAAIAGPNGVRDALLRNQGDGAFEDVTRSSGFPENRASLGVAAGDFDADGRVDLYLTSAGGNRLFRNRGSDGFADITAMAGVGGPPAVSLTARWLDLDQDGDLDLYVVNYADLEHVNQAFTDHTPPGAANVAYRNDGQPPALPGRPVNEFAPVGAIPQSSREKDGFTAGLSVSFTRWPDPRELDGGTGPHTGLAVLDIDGDRDLDLVTSADGAPPSVILNDRLGHFHASTLGGAAPFALDGGLLAADLDQDGRTDLVRLESGGRIIPLTKIRTAPSGHSGAIASQPWPCDAQAWRSAIACDLDLEGRPDLLGLSAAGTQGGVVWATNDGRGLKLTPLALGPDGSVPRRSSGLALADLIGNPLPDLLILDDTDGPRLAKNLGNGQHWLSLTLAGRWQAWGRLRSNPHGIGARVQLEGPGLNSFLDTAAWESGLAQSVAPKVVGLHRHDSAALVRILWPDGARQTEMNIPADKAIVLEEQTHRISTCPILFAWNGNRYRCVSDLLAGGGLGYLMAPGVYAQPDRDESVAIPDDLLRPVDGRYKIVIAEPMDEVAYVDHLVLDVVDRPPGVKTAPDERFTTGGRPPTGELIAWRTVIEPERATDLTGRDFTEVLRSWDRTTVDGYARVSGWNGYAEEHGIVLDFGDRLSRFGPDDRLVLCLAGWVEYPFSQANYAAATAGVPLRFPVLERRKTDGSWEILEANPGCPAGLPRLTTLDLTNRLSGAHCVLRLRTNLEVYWDQAFVALAEPNRSVRVTSVPVTRAVLGYRGYMREASPDGHMPMLYDYDAVVPMPLARMSGRLTRYGDVTELLRADDDRLCLVGPGDEVRVEFDANQQPALPAGWTRGYVLRATGYCKDADLCTATGDSVGPLPWRGMECYPYGAGKGRPADPTYDAYLWEYQTRPAGVSR
jgi:FG-GAP-like repeat/ASPIC and UnbV